MKGRERLVDSVVVLVLVCVCVSQYSLRWPVIWFTTLIGPGPTANTVFEPAAIWVRPAS